MLLAGIQGDVRTGPPTKTFGGDAPGINSHPVFYTLRIISFTNLKPDTETRNRLTESRSLGPTFERRTTVSLHRAKNLIDPPLSATRNADRKLPAVSGLWDGRLDGLCKFLRKQLAGGAWTIHCGLPAAHGHLHRCGLSAGEKLALGHAPGRCYCNEEHQKFGFQHWLPN